MFLIDLKQFEERGPEFPPLTLAQWWSSRLRTRPEIAN
jgi:hypothetical protein